MVVQSCLDGHRSLVEIPDLGLSSIWCLNDHVSVANQVKVSVFGQLGDNVEVSLNEETEVFVKFSLLWFLWIFISEDDVPLLVDLSCLCYNLDVLVLLVNAA